MNANMKVSEQCRIAESKGNQVLGMIRRNITYKEKSLIIPLNGGQLKSHQQYVKRRKPGRLLKRSRSTEISLTEGCCIYMDRRKKQPRKL